MKWDATESTRGKFNFGQADQTVKFATDNKILVRGHTTVWHSQLPSWVTQIRDKATLTTVIQDHVQGVMGHFKGQVYAFDVINEMFECVLFSFVYFLILEVSLIELCCEVNFRVPGARSGLARFSASVSRLREHENSTFPHESLAY